MLRFRVVASALLGFAFSGAGTAVQAQATCPIEEAQQLFGRQPRPVATIDGLLAQCIAAGSQDYRVPLFKGVMARDADRTGEALQLLRESHRLAPREAVPMLELAFTLEEREPLQAVDLYNEVLSADPASRPALLGVARVVRSRHQLDRARQIYQGLLAKNPQDIDALNGLAWVALADKRHDEARAGFEQVLAIQPGNVDAGIGMSQLSGAWRYRLDIGGGFVSSSAGSSASAGANLQATLDARSTLEIGAVHYTNEVPTVSFAGRSMLPAVDVRLGYFYQVPKSFNAGLAYDFRAHSGAPGEHWIEPGAGVYVTDFLQAFASYRQSFGAPQWNNWLARTGLAASLTEAWEAVGTFYVAGQQDYNNFQPILSWSVDINHHGPFGALYSAGVGYSPTLNNVDLHARAVLPLTDRVALLANLVHYSINDDTRGTFGVRLQW